MSIYENITGEKPKKKKKKTSEKEMLELANKLTQKDIAPVRNPFEFLSEVPAPVVKSNTGGGSGRSFGAGAETESNTWLKRTEESKKIDELWDNGYDFGDVTKTLLGATKNALNTGKDALVQTGKGFLNTVEGAVDAVRYGVSDVYKKMSDIAPDMPVRAGTIYLGSSKDVSDKLKKNAQYEVTKNLLGEENDIFKENWSEKVSEESALGTKGQNVFQGVGNIGAFVGLGQLSGSSSLGTFLNSFSSAYGNSRTEAYKNGADDKTANRAGWISGLAEAISEQFFSGIPGMETAGWGDALNGRISQSISKYLGSKGGKLALTLFDGIGEGSEEILSNMFNAIGTDVMHYIDENYTYGMENMSGNIGKDTLDAMFSQDSLDSFVSAMLTSILTGGGKQVVQNIQTNQASKQVASQGDITSKQAKSLINQIVEKRADLDLDKDVNYKERTEYIDNQKQQFNKEIKQAIKAGQEVDLNEIYEGLLNREKYIQAIGTGSVTSKGLDLTESYKAYNGDVKYKKQIANIQKFMNNRNIDARFDATMFDNNEQNAIWTTENGKDSVIFNPKASADQVIQNIATHEMTHDIINQKTEAGTSLFNDVLENIKTQENYAKDRQEIEDLYAKYYDRNSEDFSAKVDEEMVANELGKNLGTQEYINKLVGEKPNLAKRIYNWVVDKLDNIGKSEEYKEQKAYWKSVADKFEVAYNEQKTATGEDKTAYSVKQSKAMLEKQFKELTGDNVTLAEAKLAGYAVRQLQRENGNLGGVEESPYNQEAMDLLEKIQNSKKTSSHLYHSTPADRIQSIIQNGLQVGSKQNQEGVSSTNKLYLSATEDLASSFTPQDSVMLRISPNANLENLDNDLLGGEGSYTITNNIDPKYLQVKENGKWIPLLKSKYATETRYSLSKDNTGRELSEGQREYFKDSKATDENGDLVTVYHTTTDYTKQFNEFNPVGTEGYKYGDVAVNFYTDSKDMSSSYGHNIISPYTQQINSMEDVNRQLGERYRIEEKNGKYELYDNNDAIQLNNYEDLIKLFSKEEQDILNKTFNKSRSEVIEMLNNDEQFDLYDKTRQKFLNMLYLMNEGKGVKQSGTNRTIDELVDNYLNNKTIQPLKTFNNQEDLFRNITEAISPVEHYQYSGYLNIKNPYIVDGENKNWNNITRGISAENEKIYNSLTQKEKNYLSDLADKMDNMYPDYQDSVEGFYQRLNANNEKLYNKIAYNSSIRQKLFDTALYGWNDTYVNDLIGERETTNDIVKEVIDLNNNGYDYDGVIIKNIKDYGANSDNFDMNQANDVYITFGSNQFKAVDNLNPTEDADIRYSMQQEETPFTQGTRTTMGELFNEIAPIRQDLSNITEQMNNLSNQIETMQQSLENTSKGYVETYNEQRNENIPTRNLTEEDANTLQDALMQDEGYLRSLDEQANQMNDNTKLIDKLTRNVAERIDLERGQKETLREIIQKSIDNNLSADEISYELYKEFSELSYDMTNQEAIEAKRFLRDIPIKVSDTIKKDIADYGDFKRHNFGKINFSNNGGPVDSVYMELSEQMPYYFPSDIINPTEQLLRIAEVANMASKVTETIDIEPEYFDNIADYIKNTQLNDEYEAQMKSQEDLETDIRMNLIDDIAPTTIRTQESIEDTIANRDIAPVKQDKTQQRQEKAEQRSKAWRIFREMFSNRNAVIDDTAQATGNSEIKYKGDAWNNAPAEANFNISNYQTDINGDKVGEGLDTIWKSIEDAGETVPFNDYLIQKSNIERHNVGKGSVVPVEVSRQLVAQYDKEYPHFKEKASEVYNFINNFSLEEVDSGLISTEKYNDYRGENGIYGEYVPFVPAETDTSRYFDDSGESRAFSTFKRSKGGAGDVNQLLSVKEAIANQVKAVKSAVAFNELAKEIVQTYGRDNEIFDVDTRTNIADTSDSLLKTEDGDYILSAYIDGEKVSTKISEELYNELSRTTEKTIRNLEDTFSFITKPLQWISDKRRKMLTTWNATFLTRNAIKDPQEAVINSKHTTDMLGYLNGLKKGHKPALLELQEGKTKEAKRFLAKMGSGGDATLGEYSNTNKAKKIAKKLLNANEYVELAPRFAEYLATLENGGTQTEALYNAREVTTNFGRGGYITKALNRNGFTFLNANVQGLSKVVRNLSGENGVKGVVSVVAKGAMYAVLPSILNHILYGLGDDKDEEYEALPDYIKDNYYLIKLESGKFLRIPKGRINAVFGSFARRTLDAIEGEDNPYKDWGSNAWSQIGVGDLGGNNILSPLIQAYGSKNGEAWYGGDIVPTRLQDKPAEEQTDASIDAVSNFLGETFGISPYKLNYVLDQYTGGLGDVLLPMITPETSSGAETVGEYLTAPIKDAFIVNSIDDNKYAGEFYDLKDKLEVQKNSSKATEEDKLRYKYMDGKSWEMSELYKERREVQADTTLSNKEKYAKVQAIQNEINNLAKEALSSYQDVTSTDYYSNVSDKEYYKNNEGKWTEVKDEEQEFTAGLTNAEKDAYYKAKDKISNIYTNYNNQIKDLKKDDPKKQQLYADKKEEITQAIVNSGLDNQTKAMVYAKYYSSKDNMTNAVNSGYNIDTYITALNDIDQLRNKYSQKNGYSVEQRKKKTIAYINSLNMNIPQKAMLIRQYYTSYRSYNADIVKYVSNLNIPYEDKKAILEGTGMKVNGNKISWK